MNNTVFIFICLCCVIYSSIMMFRNKKVYQYSNKILDQVSIAAKSDISKGRNFEWRYNAFNSVSYVEMVNQFWRKLDSFYPDKSFIDPKAKEPKQK